MGEEKIVVSTNVSWYARGVRDYKDNVSLAIKVANHGKNCQKTPAVDAAGAMLYG
jgi:hypothetical protein